MNNTQENIQNGVNDYFQPKSSTDIDMVTEVRNLLVGCGLLEQTIMYYDTNRFIIEAINKPSHVQRFLLNRYWNQQLSSSKAISIEQRYFLIPNGEIREWLEMFRSAVLPFVMQNGLPTQI